MQRFIRRFHTTNVFDSTISNFTKNNIKHIDCFELRIINPKKLSFMRPVMYEGTISFSKDNLHLYKTFSNNDFQKLMSDVNNFLNNEIKI